MKTKKKNKFFMIGLLSAFLLLGGIFLGFSPAPKTAYADNPLSDFKFTQIGSGYSIAAQNKNITHADIPPTYLGLPVVEIAANGFASCPNLETVVIPASVKRISTGAFTNCGKMNDLRTAGAEIISQNAFALCKKIKTLVLPGTVQTVGANILLNAGTEDTTIYSRVPENIADTWTGWRNGFSGNVIYGDDLICDLTEDGDGYIVGPQGFWNNTLDLYIDTHNNLPIVEIDMFAFSGCVLKSVNVGFSSDHEINIKSYAFSWAAIPTIKLDNNVTFDDENSTGDEYNNYDEKSNSIFYGSMLEQIVLPDTLHSILPMMFQDCKELESISYNSTPTQINILPSHVSAIYENAFSGCRLPSLSFSDSIAKAGQTIFNEWSEDDEQKIYLSFTKANITSFKQTWYATNYQEGWNDYWDSGCGDNVIHYTVYDVSFNPNGGTGTMSGYQRLPVGEKEVLRTNVFTLSGRDFVGWSKVSNPTRVGIFDGYKVLDIAEPGDTIPLYAIWSTIGLSYSLLSDNTYNVSIGTATANYIFIPTYHDGIVVSKIVANAFSSRTNILDFTLPRKVEIIGDYAFAGCTNLTYFEIPGSVTYLGQGMLDGCYNLASIVFPGNGTAPGDVTFKKMFGSLPPPSLKKVTISGGDRIPKEAFYNCSYIEEIELPDTIKIIEANAFNGCLNLKNIILQEGLEYIDGGAFKNCKSLETITIPKSVTGFYNEVFWNCTNLKTIIIKRPASMGFMNFNLTAIGYPYTNGNLTLVAVADSDCESEYRSQCIGGYASLADLIHSRPDLM